MWYLSYIILSTTLMPYILRNVLLVVEDSVMA